MDNLKLKLRLTHLKSGDAQEIENALDDLARWLREGGDFLLS